MFHVELGAPFHVLRDLGDVPALGALSLLEHLDPLDRPPLLAEYPAQRVQEVRPIGLGLQGTSDQTRQDEVALQIYRRSKTG